MKQYDPVKLRREVRNAADALVSLNRAVSPEGEPPAVSSLHAVWLRLDFYFEASRLSILHKPTVYDVYFLELK
jgi:hypothetical protein